VWEVSLGAAAIVFFFIFMIGHLIPMNFRSINFDQKNLKTISDSYRMALSRQFFMRLSL
jgi:hypothetical protein